MIIRATYGYVSVNIFISMAVISRCMISMQIVYEIHEIWCDFHDCHVKTSTHPENTQMFGVESMLIDSHIMMRDTRELTVISMLVNNNTYIKLYTIVGVGMNILGKIEFGFEFRRSEGSWVDAQSRIIRLVKSYVVVKDKIKNKYENFSRLRDICGDTF